MTGTDTLAAVDLPPGAPPLVVTRPPGIRAAEEQLDHGYVHADQRRCRP